MHDHPRNGSEWHPMGCRCRDCLPPAPSDRPPLHERLELNRIAGWMILGFFAGMAIIAVMDAAGIGRGVEVLFGGLGR